MAFSHYLFFFTKDPSQKFDQVLHASLILSTPPNYFCVRIIKTSRFLFLFPQAFMYWSKYLLLCILSVVHQTVLDIALLFHIIFILLAKSVLSSCQHLFLYFIFICKNVIANPNGHRSSEGRPQDVFIRSVRPCTILHVHWTSFFSPLQPW